MRLSDELFDNLSRQRARETEEGLLRQEARTRCGNVLLVALALVAVGAFFWLSLSASEAQIEKGYEVIPV